MHTFFVNTDRNLLDADDGNVERYLFANLKNSNKLMFYNSDLEELSACARQICEVIDKDEAIDTDFNVIIYIDIGSGANDADVYENVYLMTVNENFASELYRRGKNARNIQVIFGEHFDRKDQFKKEQLNGNKLWTVLGFPSINDVETLIGEIKERALDRSAVNDCLSTDFVKLQESENTASLIGNDLDFYREIVVRLIDALANKIENNIETDLTEELSIAFEFIGNIQHKRYAQNALDFITLFVADADEHMENRSAYRLYLYIYYCAANGKILKSLPDVDWAQFAHIIAVRQPVFRKERAHIQGIVSEFDFLNTSGIGGEDVKASMKTDLFAITHAVPRLTQTGKKLGRFLRIKRLKQQQEEVLTDLAEKNERNETLIGDFIVQIRENYIDGKGDAMEKKRKGFREKKDGTKVIDSTVLTMEKTQRFKAETEGFIAGQGDLQTENINFREKIKEAREKTEYWFACIWRHWWFAVVFTVVWGLFFAVPYLWIQHSHLDYYDYGMPVFFINMGVVALAFWGAYFYFRRTYKQMIKKEIRGIINAFNKAQAAKEKNAHEFKWRLTHYYPRSEVLRSYYEDVLQYERDEKELNLLKDYHKGYLRGFSDEYIKHLLYNLDISHFTGAPEEPDPATFIYRLDINTIRHSAAELADLYYIMTKDSINKVLREGGGA